MTEWNSPRRSERAFVPQGCDQQGRYVPTISVEGCAVEDDQSRDAGWFPVIALAVACVAFCGIAAVVITVFLSAP